MKEVKQLLLDALTLCNSIDNDFSLFSGIDDNHRLNLIKDAQESLRKKVVELNNILNNK